MNDFKLISKKNLTNDVYELVFECSNELKSISWQFITFMLPITKFARAYSILNQDKNNFSFIIKRLENGRWWSKEICDIEVWTILKWVWPVWKFLINDKTKNKLFIWTWTWIVPFYYQIKELVKEVDIWKNKLLIWNRTLKDLYYLDEFKKLENESFGFEVFLSQEEVDLYNYWRVGNYITKENVTKYDEFYICWNPEMIDDIILKLKNLWVDDWVIFTEKY